MRVVVLLAEVGFDLVALRAGAFSAVEVFMRRLGCAAFVVSPRAFKEDLEGEERGEAGRVGDRLTPLTIGSLMRSTRILKSAAQPVEQRPNSGPSLPYIHA